MLIARARRLQDREGGGDGCTETEEGLAAEYGRRVGALLSRVGAVGSGRRDGSVASSCASGRGAVRSACAARARTRAGARVSAGARARLAWGQVLGSLGSQSDESLHGLVASCGTIGMSINA